MSGGDGDDDLVVGDFFFGDAGNDVIHGAEDRVTGGPGHDFVSGDYALGGVGNDDASGAPDIVLGESGEDFLGGDSLIGQEGDDQLVGADDQLDSGPGDHRRRRRQRSRRARRRGVRRSGHGFPILGDDSIATGDGDDELFGDLGDPLAFPGGIALESVFGGDDYLDCGPADDLADGGPGTDTATACETAINVEITL